VVQRKTSKPGRSPKPATTTPARATARKASPKPRVARVDLALQGGGAHGAFTWGVLDRLLEEPWIAFDGISGTSAGAMNAVVMADGLAHGGPEGARAALEAFWRRVSDGARLSPLKRGPLEILTGSWTLDYSPVFTVLDLAARVLSPYDTNPMGSNPLRQILLDSVDFERLAAAPIKLFVTATNVRTGKGCSRRWRSTASPTGTAATPAIRRCPR
jgi:NTE family protein